MLNDTKPILHLLQQVSGKVQHKLEHEVANQLDDRERRVWDWLFEQYQDETRKRWYDPYHILFSTDFAFKLIAAEGLSRLIIPGIILHDIGYFALEDKSQWSANEARITHMQEGVPLAARVLYENGYSASEVEIILGMISVHDNPYIGLPIRGKDRLGMRDCDRIWVMHLISFYKDLCSKSESGSSHIDFLHNRIIQFFAYDQPFGKEWQTTPEKIALNASRIEIPAYAFTRLCVQKQITSRIRELEEDILADTARLEDYLNRQIEAEAF